MDPRDSRNSRDLQRTSRLPRRLPRSQRVEAGLYLSLESPSFLPQLPQGALFLTASEDRECAIEGAVLSAPPPLSTLPRAPPSPPSASVVVPILDVPPHAPPPPPLPPAEFWHRAPVRSAPPTRFFYPLVEGLHDDRNNWDNATAESYIQFEASWLNREYPHWRYTPYGEYAIVISPERDVSPESPVSLVRRARGGRNGINWRERFRSRMCRFSHHPASRPRSPPFVGKPAGEIYGELDVLRLPPQPTEEPDEWDDEATRDFEVGLRWNRYYPTSGRVAKCSLVYMEHPFPLEYMRLCCECSALVCAHHQGMVADVLECPFCRVINVDWGRKMPLPLAALMLPVRCKRKRGEKEEEKRKRSFLG